MALTADFRETVQARAKRDAAFREGLLSEAIESLLLGEVSLGKQLLRDYINATVGFPKLAAHTKVHVKTFTRCLAQAEIDLPAICLKSSPICSTRRVCDSKSDPHTPHCGRGSDHLLVEQNALLLR